MSEMGEETASTGCECEYRENAFESRYRENAPRRHVSLSNRLKLVLKHP